MKIGIMSDSHDDLEALRHALRTFSEHGCDMLIHCGDLCAPFIIPELDAYGKPVHVVYGNIDDRARTALIAKDSTHVTHHGDIAMLEIDGKRIIVNHYPEIATAFALSGRYDLICYGHTHRRDHQIHGSTILLNPGELMGRLGERSIAIYDTSTREVIINDL